MKKTTFFLITITISIWQPNLFSQTFEKITNSPINDPMEAIGTSWGDFDSDGDLDLFINAWTSSVDNPKGYGRFYLNNCNGDFTRITAIPENILNDEGTWAGGTSWIDYNNDGFIDLYSGHDGGRNNSLYHNNGDGTFTQIIDLLVVNDSAYTRGHTWGDLNNDGWLDLFLGNDGGNSIHQSDILYLSNGSLNYTKVTTGDIVNDNIRTQGFSFGDYNNDGYIDIYVTSLNKLYQNNGDGTFTTITNTIASQAWNGWSCSWVDFDNDLDLDLFFHGAFGWRSRMLINNGDGTFSELLNDPLTTTIAHNNGGQQWGDYDNDGDLDILVSDFYKNQLYSNNGNGTFTRITNEIVGNDDIAEAYGATWNDYDKDGDLDLFIPNAFGNPPNYFYINTYQNNGNQNNWVNIKCKGVQSNSSAIGARIYVKATINGQSKWQMREVNANHSCPHGGVNPLEQHFGLGDAVTIDSLKIYWTVSETTQIFTNISPNRYIEITENDNTIYDVKQCLADLPPTNAGYVKGMVYEDIDSNCTYNPTVDNLMPNTMVKASVGDYYVVTDDNGEYELRLPEKDYNISLPENNNCNTDYDINVIENQTLQNFDFADDLLGLECGVTMSNISTGQNPCPGQTTQLTFSFVNNGPAITDFLTNISATPNYITIVSNSCGSNLPANSVCTITINVTIPNDPNLLNTNININVDYTGICKGDEIGDNEFFTIPIDCAFDPNDKTLLSPEACGDNNIISKSEELIYRLRFQNIGTAPATNILVSDKLDPSLDITSYKLLSTSHNLSRFEIIPENNLIFKFDSIMLPDSSTNLLESNGYIVYSIKPKTGLADGTIIKNSAGIYFDYNEVVITNTTSNMLMTDFLPIANFTNNHSCNTQGFVYDFTYTGDYTGLETFYWDFGTDAIPQTSTEINPSNIIFTSGGNKDIVLIVDRGGCNASITKNLIVEDMSCGNNKILVCHNGNTICISKNALPAHLEQGYCIGRCDNNKKSAIILSDEKLNGISLYYSNNNSMVVINTPELQEKVFFDIYDYSGKLILTHNFNYLNKGQTNINIQNIAKGAYIGVLRTDINRNIVKIIKY
jgi:uncharacterized repeat protein (TIGR01451 family)